MFLTICKNVIASNNKRNWKDPIPSIRIGSTKSSPAIDRAHRVGIVDSDGKIVAELISSKDGKAVVTCGAKVALVTDFDPVILE